MGDTEDRQTWIPSVSLSGAYAWVGAASNVSLSSKSSFSTTNDQISVHYKRKYVHVVCTKDGGSFICLQSMFLYLGFQLSNTEVWASNGMSVIFAVNIFVPELTLVKY